MPHEIEFEDPRIGFASAHFIVGHDKCGRLHGHNYFIKVKLKGELDNHHMVLDYGDLKTELKKLTKTLDHRVIIPSKAKGLDIKELDDSVEVKTCGKRYVIPTEDTIFLPLEATTSSLSIFQLLRNTYFLLKYYFTFIFLHNIHYINGLVFFP